MSLRFLSAIAVSLTLAGSISAYSSAQDTDSPSGQTSGGNGGGWGQRGGRGGRGGGAGMMGRGVEGTVTEITADHLTIKNFLGEIYTIHYSANTRFLKQPPESNQGSAQANGQASGQANNQGGGQGSGQGNGWGRGRGQGMGAANRPTPIKVTDIKVGDAVGAMGEVDANAKSVGAVAVVEMDPQRAKEMQQMEANYGKTWLMGKVTAIDGVKVTILGSVDQATHSFVADENTVFRKRRDPVTLADIQVGDIVRVEGADNPSGFAATSVNVMGAPGQGTNIPRGPRPE